MKLGKFELDKIYCGDSKELMEDVPSNKVDLIVTDPPYGYSFMGKDWDKAIIPIPYWKECFRVLKPGAFIFVMSSPRQDVLMRAIGNLEKAGFNTGFTSIYWTYASGFPKATNIGKMIDKQECKKQLTKKLGRKPTKEEFKIAWKGFREVIGKGKAGAGMNKIKGFGVVTTQGGEATTEWDITKGTSELEGSYAGFQPKPAVEVIIVAMKPLSEKTYVDQALKNRKGITWLDDGRIPYESEGTVASNPKLRVERGYKTKTGDRIFCQGELGKKNTMVNNVKTGGRFPANLLVSDDVLNDGRVIKGVIETGSTAKSIFGSDGKRTIGNIQIDSGSFSRYFDLDSWAVSQGVKDTFPFIVCAKASKSEKNKGLENFPEREWGRDSLTAGIDRRNTSNKNPTKLTKYKPKNIHPTVKPIKLMSYLIMLGSRKGDIILDNFCGSGSTLVSAKLLNRRFLGFDTEMEYVEISRARLSVIKQIQEKLL